FKKMDMLVVIINFLITAIDYSIPENLQKVTMQTEYFIRIIKARLIDNSNQILLIKLTKAHKNHVKALIHCFFNYSHELYGEKKHGQAKKYADLYLKSFDVFDRVDYTNFSDNLALDYSKDIKDYLRIKD